MAKFLLEKGEYELKHLNQFLERSVSSSNMELIKIMVKKGANNFSDGIRRYISPF